MQTIQVDIGDGLKFYNNKITLNIDQSSNVMKRDDGIYVAGDTTASEELSHIPIYSTCTWTIYETQTKTDEDEVSRPSGMLNFHRHHIQMIFSMCLYKITTRTKTSVEHGDECKSIIDICSEINYPLNHNIDYSTSYNLQHGDLFQLVNSAHGRKVETGYSFEDGKRYYGENEQTLALFYVDKVKYYESIPQKIKDLVLRCIWRDDKLTDKFSVGEYYDNY